MKDLQYVAGYFDGEGYVGVPKTNGCYNVRVSLSNTYLPALVELQKQFGGVVSAKSKQVKPTHRKTYHWRIGGQPAKEFLIAILPYLDEKKQQAELAILLPRRKPGNRRTQDDGNILQEQIRIHDEVKRLKHIEW